MSIFVALCTALVIGGVFVLVAAYQGYQWRPTVRADELLDRIVRPWRYLDRAQRVRLVIGIPAGLAATLATGFIPWLVLIPALVFLLPELLGTPQNTDLMLLEALDKWIRMVQASCSTGKSVIEALRSTVSQAPEVLREPIRVLLAKLDERWSIRLAFQGFADEFHNADVDAVCAALIVIAERGGIGASTTMTALSQQVRDRLHAWRDINAEREKPRVVVRQVSVITVIVLGAALLISPGYFAPFTTPLGQVLASLLMIGYLVSLYGLQRAARPRRRERIMVTLEEAGHGR